MNHKQKWTRDQSPSGSLDASDAIVRTIDSARFLNEPVFASATHLSATMVKEPTVKIPLTLESSSPNPYRKRLSILNSMAFELEETTNNAKQEKFKALR